MKVYNSRQAMRVMPLVALGVEAEKNLNDGYVVPHGFKFSYYLVKEPDVLEALAEE